MSMTLKTALKRVVEMGQSDLASDIRELLSLLDDDDWQMRRAASQAVTARLGDNNHSHQHALIFSALISAILDKSRAGCRAAAIAALETIGKPALPFLETAIRTASPGGQVALAGVVGSAGGPQAVQILAALVIQNSDTNVVAAALTALGKTNEPTAFPILSAALSSTDDWLTFSVVGALGDLGDERGIPLLEPLLDNPMLEEATTLALVQIRTVEAAQVMVKHCYSESGNLRESVLLALATLYNESGLAPRAMTELLRASIRTGFRVVANEDMLSVLAAKTASQNSELARSALLALGWLGRVEGISIIARTISDPALTRASRIALSDLVATSEPLLAIVKGARFDIAFSEVAIALVPHHSVSGIEAAVEIMLTKGDSETSESGRYALSSAREWISKSGSSASASTQ